MESLQDNINRGRAPMEKIKIFKLSPDLHWLLAKYKNIERQDSVSKEAHRVDEASSVNFLAQSGKPW